MLITDKFVMINFPKTGSTFARKALFQVHAPSRLDRILQKLQLAKPELEELIMHKFFFTEAEKASKPEADQHGGCMQIPEKHKGKEIMSVVRDPETRLVSAYEFKAWQRQVFPSVQVLKEQYPHFPDLSFAEFLEATYANAHVAQPPGVQVQIGPLTTQFIRFYARDPLKTIQSLREDTDLRKDRDLHFPKIQFLHTENLNQEFHDFLLGLGYAPDRIAFILNKKKENITKRSQESYITPEIRRTIQDQERFFYQVFPDYVHDQGPTANS